MTEQDSLREQLAAIEHERWAGWQKYLHSRCIITKEGLLIPASDVNHWERQIKTPYSELSPIEQKSDMEQVDRYWQLIEHHTAQAVREAEVKLLDWLEIDVYDETPDDVTSHELGEWIEAKRKQLTQERSE